MDGSREERAQAAYLAVCLDMDMELSKTVWKDPKDLYD